MTADLPPDVRAEAAQAAFRAYWERETVSGMAERHWRDAVDAVTAVVAPQIARPLQARIEELEKTLSDNRKLWDESIAQTGAALEQSQRIYAEFVTGQHEEALTRVTELEAALEEERGANQGAMAALRSCIQENRQLRRTSIVDNAYAGREIKVAFDDE